MSHAPIGHRVGWVEARGLLIGCYGLGEVESPRQTQPLVEEGLGLGVIGGNRAAVGTAARYQDGTGAWIIAGGDHCSRI